MLKTILILFTTMFFITACTPSYDTFRTPKWESIKEDVMKYTHDRKFKSLTELNYYVNLVKYVPDKEDEWKTPRQFFKEGGDCEDYVIAKISLVNQNFPQNIQQFFIVWDTHSKDYHAVLWVFDVNNKKGYVLDNNSQKLLSWDEAKERYNFIARVRL